ncbi:MAG: ATP-grasp domain-containing protein [Thermoproteota archaeon]
MEKVGILIVSYGARAVAMVDAFAYSTKYDARLYIADKQRNPFNVEKSFKHIVVPDLNVNKICKFAEKNRENIDFGIVGPEKPIINGIRDFVEDSTGIPIICPTQKYAIEVSKVAQRRLLQEIVPEVNPRFKIFNPEEYQDLGETKKAVYGWLDQLEDKAVVKPDQPAAGKGVGVWGDHFTTREELFDHFYANLQYGSVIIEEKIEGEESSFQAFCDGKNLVPLPDTRDYKRAFDGDKGPNTGGMGSYKDAGDVLPFMTAADREKEVKIAKRLFEKWADTDNEGLRGIPFYLAFIHTGEGPKILENNSRPGDPEIQNILPILKDDFVDICFKMLEETLHRVELKELATVVTYKVPPNYGGYKDVHPHHVNSKEIGQPVNLKDAYQLKEKYGENIRVYPASMELRDHKTYPLSSRTVCVVGSGIDIETAREISLQGLDAIKGGGLWYRTDIASERDIQQSIRHMEELRRHKN